MDTAFDFFFNNSLRIEKMMWLPAAIADVECTCDDFEEFVDFDLPEGRAEDQLLEQLPCLRRFTEGEDAPEVWVVADALMSARVNGFLFKLAHPIMDYDRDGVACGFSWGHYRTQWLYAATIDDIVSVAQKQLDLWEAHDKERGRSKAA